MADSSILDGNRWPHWGQFCGLSTPAKVDLRGGPPERLEPACGCNSSARIPTRRTVAATTEEAGEAEQVAEVVPSSVVVELVDIEVAFEQ